MIRKMSAEELEDFIGLIEKTESEICNTDIYSPRSSVPMFSIPDCIPPLWKESSRIPRRASSRREDGVWKEPMDWSRAPKFGRVISKDLTPAITPESSPNPLRRLLNRRKVEVVESENNKVVSPSRSPSPPRVSFPKPFPRPSRPLSTKPLIPKTVDLRDYSKSLQMIGISLPSTEKSSLPPPNTEGGVRVENSRPSSTLKTRLTHRTQSLSDIREVIQEGQKELPLEKFQEIKRNLCDAVFEEWYFKKMEIEANKRSKLQLEKEKKKQEEEHKKEKAEENFKNWLRTKKSLKTNLPNYGVDRNDSRVENKSEDVEIRIYKEKVWLERKKKELEQKRRSEIEAQRAKEFAEQERLEPKKLENAKHFENWSQAWTKKMKHKKNEEKMKKKAKIEEMKEKKEIAESSFKAWVLKKKTVQNSMPHKTSLVRNEVYDKSHREDRNAQAKEAFGKWLESLELRDEVRSAEEEYQLREMWKPPWYPPGLSK